MSGYTKKIAEILGDSHEYINEGVSGDTSQMVLDRYQNGIKDIKPDIMTLMIGINDVWRRFDSGIYTSVETFRNNVREIILKTKSDFPNCKIILIEPYLLPEISKKYFRPVLIEFIDAVRDIAVELADGFVPIDGIFAKERMNADWRKFSQDGVHPIEKGEEIIAEYVSEEIKKFIID